MKKLLFFLWIAGWVLPLHAQPVPQYIYNPTDSIVFDVPTNSSWFGGTGNGHYQVLFYPSDFPNMPKGYITKVYFMMVGTFNNNPRPICTVTSPHTFIGMKAYDPPPDENGSTAMSLPPCDASQTPPAQWVATDTVFYADSFQYQVTIDSGDWLGITLQKPFLYDPAHNFIVDLSVLARTPTWFCKWFTAMLFHYYSPSPNVRHYVGLSDTNATHPTTDVLGCGGANFIYIGFDLTPVQDVATVAVQGKALRIAPNPATSVLNIEHATTGYQITDVTGKTLLQGSKPTQQIDISSLAKGIYFFRSGAETLKFIKQ